IAIVFLTSIISERETRYGSALLGAFQILAKPIRLGRVIACIEKHLGTADPYKQSPTERTIA
ncbi:MAG: hypothetical protein ABSH14_13930, partial [Verrucomicrobiia bacterium]